MRSLLIASAGLALIAGSAADARQRVVQRGPGASYGMPGHAPMPQQRPMGPGPGMRPNPGVRPMPGNPGVRPMPGRPGGQQIRGQRWGSKIGGRWWGGANAPGGWAGYRRPTRGWAVPTYWNSPRFYVNDWAGYGLTQPYNGYNWVRYYDDAVLIDQRGSVYDTVGGLDWDGGYRDGGYQDGGYQGGYGDAYADDSVYAGPDDRGYARRDDRRDDRGRDNGVGGAVIGGVVGGVAGNVIAGRGNRLGGTLIGAGVGAAAGYAIDKNEDRGRRGPPPRYARQGDGYGSGYGAGYSPPPVPVYRGAPGGSWVSQDGATTVTTTSGYPGYGGGSTTVVVQSAPVVTTTTTTEYYDAVTYSRPRKVWRKRTGKMLPRCNCR